MTVRELIERLEELPEYYEVKAGGHFAETVTTQMHQVGRINAGQTSIDEVAAVVVIA